MEKADPLESPETDDIPDAIEHYNSNSSLYTAGGHQAVNPNDPPSFSRGFKLSADIPDSMGGSSDTDRETVRSEYDRQMEAMEESRALAREAAASSHEPESPNGESHGLGGNAATREPVASLIDVPMLQIPTLPESEPYSHNSGILFDPTPEPGTFISEMADLGANEGVPFVPPTREQTRNMQIKILGKTHLLKSIASATVMPSKWLDVEKDFHDDQENFPSTKDGVPDVSVTDVGDQSMDEDADAMDVDKDVGVTFRPVPKLKLSAKPKPRAKTVPATWLLNVWNTDERYVDRLRDEPAPPTRRSDQSHLSTNPRR